MQIDRETIDQLWQKAMRQAIEDGEQFTRYRFAKLVAEHEREACAKLCGELHLEGEDNTGLAADLIQARGNT